MKKLLSLTLALLCVFSLASCMGSTATCEKHIDADGNMYCDTCAAIYICPDHIDADENALCDTCSAPYSCLGHADANKDGKCDRCKAPYTCPGHEDLSGIGQCDICNAYFTCIHVDADDNGECDNCLAYFTCVSHQDNDADGKCDVCEGTYVCVAHKDANVDGACDFCGESYVCIGHIDADEDGKCDECGASGSALEAVNPRSIAAFSRAYKNSLPTKITTSTRRTIGTGAATYTLTSSSTLKTGTVGGKIATVLEESKQELRDVDSGAGDTVESVYKLTEIKKEFVQGKGVRTTENGVAGNWNQRETNFAPTLGSIAIGIQEGNVNVRRYTIDEANNSYVVEFTVSKDNVAAVFGMNGAIANIDATSDVTVVLTSNGATITSIIIRYNIDATKEVPEQTVVIEAYYEYSIQNITIG